MVSKEIDQAIKAVDEASYALGTWDGRRGYDETERTRRRQALDDANAALIALLARDDARIARLENVSEIAKAICDDANPDVVDGAWAVPDGLYWELHHALDADAPGGG